MPADWEPLPPPPLSPRQYPRLHWTGEELLVLSGREEPGTQSASAPGGCRGDESVWFRDGAAWSPTTRRWRQLPGDVTFHHGPVWTGTALTDGYTTYDPRTGASERVVPECRLLVYGSADWTGSEVLCVGSDGSGQPCAHTVWAWDAATGRTRTSAVPGPEANESIGSLWTGDELLVTTRGFRPGTYAWNPATDRWRTLATGADSLSPDGWDGEHVVELGAEVDPVTLRGGPQRLVLTAPRDASRTVVELPEGLVDERQYTEALVAPGHTLVVNGRRSALLGPQGWTALPEVPADAATVDDVFLTWGWAGDHVVVWANTADRTGWSIAVR